MLPYLHDGSECFTSFELWWSKLLAIVQVTYAVTFTVNRIYFQKSLPQQIEQQQAQEHEKAIV